MVFKNVSNKKNITIGIILSFVTLLTSLVLHVFYTRFLVNSVGDVQYGIYSYAISITNWLTVLSSAIFSSYIRFVTIKQKENGEAGIKTTNSLFLFLFAIFDVIAIAFLSIIFVLLLNNVIEYQDKNLLANLLLISGVQVILSIPANIFSLYITFKGKHIWIKLVNLLGTILPPIISIPFLIKGYSITTVLTIQCCVLIGTYLLNLAFAVFHLKQSFDIGKGVFDKSFIKQIAVFSIFMILIEIVDKLNATSDQIILGSIDNGNYVSLVTVYQLSLSFSEFFASLSLAIATVFVPMIHDSVINNKKEKTDKVFIYIYTLQMFVLLLFFGGFLSCGKEFIHLWMPEHPEIFLFALILLFIRIVPLSQNASYEIQKASNKFHFRSIVNFVFALVNVAISIAFLYVLGFENGIYACLIGTVFSTFVSKWFLISRYNRKKVGLNMKRYWLSLLKSFGVLSVSSFIAVCVRQLLVLGGLSSIARFFIVGSLFTCLFVFFFLFLFSKDIVEIAYILLRKNNNLFSSCERFMKRGIYRINPSLDVLFIKKEDALRVNGNAFSRKRAPFFKRLVSLFYCNYSNGCSEECCGDVIYRSKNKTHVFDFSGAKHFIVFDNIDDFKKEIDSRNKEYPYTAPRILSFDQSKGLLCEELINFEEDKQIDAIDLICETLLSRKYKVVRKETIGEYIRSYEFVNAEIGDILRKNILSSINDSECITLSITHGDFAPGNVVFVDGKIVVVDWETAGIAPFYYDFLHYLMAEYIRTGNDDMINDYFNGVFDDFLEKLFALNDEFYNPSLKHMYYYICVISRLILFYKKDGLQFEGMLVKDKMWLNGKRNER